jgi:serine/threonine protein kinase
VDVWSLGVILFEMTHGQLPFLATNIHELKQKVQFHMPQIDSGLHPDLKFIIRGCLTKRAQNRLSVDQILSTPPLTQKPPSSTPK